MILYCVTLFLYIRHTKENLECNKLSSNPCCVDQYLNEVNNSCSECPYGSFGWNCKSTCPSGFYGRFCRSRCECDASECHHVTGCITIEDINYSPISTKHATTKNDLLQPTTIANATGEVATSKLEFEMEVELDISEKNKHHFEDADRQIGPQSDNRPYSIAEGLSENNLNETVDESSKNEKV